LNVGGTGLRARRGGEEVGLSVNLYGSLRQRERQPSGARRRRRRRDLWMGGPRRGGPIVCRNRCRRAADEVAAG